jgi:chromosome segregation ATPase
MSKTAQEWQVEVDKILAEKVAAAVKKFHEDRSRAFDELAKLTPSLDDLETQVKDLLNEKSKLNMLITPELARWNELDRKIPFLQGQAKGFRRQMEEIVQRLTAIPKDIKESTLMNFLFQLNKEKF